MLANVMPALLRPFRRLRAFMLSDVRGIGTEAREMAREARDIAIAGRRAADEARDNTLAMRRQHEATTAWVDDEIRKARVYGGLGHLLDRYPDLQGHIGMRESRVFSQNGEDGVLCFLLRRLGVASGYFVEIGAERHEANCLLLAIHQSWDGVFADGDPRVSNELAELFRHVPSIQVVNEMVDPATIDEAMSRWAVPGEIDVLSIDVDGSDYYVWRSLRTVRPKIVVIEYNAALDPDRSLVQRPDAPAWDGTVNFGCSVGALRRLGDEKGYDLVYLESSGTNAFFVAMEHRHALGDLPPVQPRAPNYHLRPTGRHPGTVDEARFVEIGRADPPRATPPGAERSGR